MKPIKPQVLLLDDEPHNLVVLEAMLRPLGAPTEIDLVSFTSPLEALAWCTAHEPDLCLFDYRMPEMTGLEFLARIRELPGFVGIPSIMITGAVEKSVRREALLGGAIDFVTKPFDVEDVRVRVRNLLALRCARSYPRDSIAQLAGQAQVVDREHELIIHKLARLSCSRDEETGNHMRRVAHIARLVAEGLGLDSAFCDTIFLAAPMHDVGKVGIPDRILLKNGKLDAVEWEVMKTHARIGHELLKDSQSPLLRMGAEIALSHHERYSGEGYPNGLRGESIPLPGRILAVADTLDALLSVRPYKQAWKVEDAFGYVRRERARHFDPACAEVLLGHRDEVLEIERRYADEIRDFAHDHDLTLHHNG